jgi:hypothetical protein
MSTAQRSRTHLVVLLALLTVLGGLGAAHAAGPLTSKQVKKIASKVVKKKAAKLKVKYAATAGDAATLSGLTAAELGTTAYTYELPVQFDADERTYTFPGLPNGTYLVSYAMTAKLADTGAQLVCGLYGNANPESSLPSYGGSYGSFSRPGASGVVTTTSETYLLCQSPGSEFALSVSNQNQVAFIKLDTATARTASGG